MLQKMYNILLQLTFLSFAFSLRSPENICQFHPGRRIYIDLGETGVLTASNVTIPTHSGPGPPAVSDKTSHYQCSVELVTCPSCVIHVAFLQLELSHQCGGGNLLIDSPCRCDYVWLSEPPYDNLPGQQFCGVAQANSSDEAGLVYESKTRSLSISLLYSESHRHAFSLAFFVKRNQKIITGTARYLYNSTGTIASPFFPSNYPRDLAVEYQLKCIDGPDCKVRIIFTDFQIGTVSFLEFFDGQNRRVDVASGLSFRPSVITSSGPSLFVRFFANGGSGLGFKAIYSFVNGQIADSAVKPITDCGGFVEDFGGAITMMNMVMEGVRSYDCVWIIRPPENFLHLKTHLSLKVATFLDFAGTTELQIRQGLTSDQPLLETLRYPVSQLHLQRAMEHIVPVNTGFYVRLKGTFNSGSRLAIAYTAFSYNKCFPGSEFLCANHRCIPGKLSCDSFDHCGDNSDEPASCFQEWDSEFDNRHWYSQTPNYFFPKTDRYADLKTATVVFLVSSLGLIALISALIILLYRVNSRARQQRELQGHLQTISELLADNARIEELEPDEPPDYEAPPEYNDIMKGPTSRRKRHQGRRPSSRRSRSSPPERRRRGGVPFLEVTLPVERRSRTHHVQCHNQRRRSSNVSVQSIGASSVQSVIPDSPPPPYSPSTSQGFIFNQSPIHISLTSASDQGPNSLTIGEEIPSWCITAVTNDSSSPPEVSLITECDASPRYHKRSQSCGDIPDEPITQRRLTQSNPLTPYESPNSIRVPSFQLTPIQTPTTDSDVCLFSSLESADINSPYIKSKDFFDWEEFDRQFPGRKGCDSLVRRGKVTELLKKYDAMVFGPNRQQCSCHGACNCYNFTMWNVP